MYPESTPSGAPTVPSAPDLRVDAPDLRVDAHVSLWDAPPPEARAHTHYPGDDRNYLPRHIAAILARSRFDGAMLVTTGTGEPERAQAVEWFAAPGALLGVVAGWSDGLPASSSIQALLVSGGLRGVWITPTSEHSFAEAIWRPALDFCRQYGLALEIAPPFGIRALEELASVADAAESTPVVLSHLGGVPRESADITFWMERVRVLAGQPNVVCKLSALHSSSVGRWPLQQVSSLFHFLIEIFGEQRLMYGSDWPYCLPEHAWKACLARFTQALGARTMAFREHILGGVAVRTYGLSGVKRGESTVSSLP